MTHARTWITKKVQRLLLVLVTLLLLPVRSKPTCSGSRIRGPLSLSIFTCSLFCPRTNLPTYESFSSHSTSLLSYINKEERDASRSKSILHFTPIEKVRLDFFSSFSKLRSSDSISSHDFPTSCVNLS